MRFTEILEELPKLTQEQRQAIYRQIEELDGAPMFEATDEMLLAIDEGTRSAQTERVYTADELRVRVRQWASSASE